MPQPAFPTSSYRLQFNREFTFADARVAVDYLAALGVTHCYASPYLKAGPGSLHGYDICNHQEFNPELGTEADYDAFSDALAARDMGHILDFVPNHMGLDIDANPWWRDVLENGPSSMFADYFDINWDPVSPELRGKILLPILHDQYGAVLERGELQLGFEAGAFHVKYFDHHVPIDPQQSPRVLRHAIKGAEAAWPEDHPDLCEYLSILTALENLPAATERDPQRAADRRREKEVARDRLARLVDRWTEMRRLIEAAVTDFNGVVGTPSSFDRLHALLEALPYRLAHWRTAFDEINYRRFFDINQLGGLRMEDPRVFEATHRLVLRLIAEQRVSGLRLDHADGLFDPAAYFRRLQNAAGCVLSKTGDDADLERAGTRRGPLYLVIEKILGADETLPEDWMVEGTTGYGFLNDVNGVFVDAAHAARLKQIYAHFTGRQETFSEVAYHAKRLIMLHSMASELNVLAQALKRIAESDRRSRDFTLNALRRALVEVVAFFPIYRTYVNESGFSATDRAAIDLATHLARQRNPAMESSIFLFLRGVLLTGAEPGLEHDSQAEADIQQRRRFAMKFQQYTAPVHAKGVEDTAYYRYNVLTSLNEVGGDPRRFGCSVDQFHAANAVRLERWPFEMIATATHDTKRGEDARARINVISEIPEEWRRAVSGWARTNATHRTVVDRESAPDRVDEYLFYQSLLGAWPAEPAEGGIPPEAPAALVERMREYMHKAIKESKVHTSWVNENVAYEGAVSRFVDGTLRGSSARRFLASFVPFQRRVAVVGMVNSLGQLVMKLASPGVSDFYQGTEGWDFHLVDPDNRRAVDFAGRRSLLQAQLPWIERAQPLASPARACPTCPPESLASHVAHLLTDWHDGRIKMFLTACGLRLRARESELILHGGYVPLTADDIGSTHLIGFARRLAGKTLLAIVPRLTAGILPPDRSLPIGAPVWGNTRIALPRGFTAHAFRNVFTGEIVTPMMEEDAASLVAADVFRTCPVALLWSVH
jgi:(1->4)-alpha-D-glucan 1-alpha-D-glucosylmutase